MYATIMNFLILPLLLVGLASSVLISSNPNGAVVSLYKETCCKSYNNGKAIKFGDDRLAFFFCPQNVEKNYVHLEAVRSSSSQS